jgi:hypothetical protein
MIEFAKQPSDKINIPFMVFTKDKLRYLIYKYNMCWNQYVSINTFLFGIFTLLLIKMNMSICLYYRLSQCN